MARILVYSHDIKNKTKLESSEAHAIDCCKIYKSWQCQKIKIIKSSRWRSARARKLNSSFDLRTFTRLFVENGLEGELKDDHGNFSIQIADTFEY
jgi:hypothetical protein